jgi:ferritin-like metal-binding protein YciE
MATEEGKQEVIKLLVEAHSNEMALINVLNAHLAISEKGSYTTLVRNHLRETERHAELIQKRLTRLGYNKSIPALAYGVAQNTIKQALVIAKAPVDVIRGRTNVREKMMRNAMDEAMTEGFEIASYDTIEAVARSVGDHETAELASEIRVDEEQMLEGLRKEIPVLADTFVRTKLADTGPVTEPWDGYDDMTVDEIKSRLDSASDSLLLEVRNYERKNKNRTTILNLTEREVAGV